MAQDRKRLPTDIVETLGNLIRYEIEYAAHHSRATRIAANSCMDRLAAQITDALSEPTT